MEAMWRLFLLWDLAPVACRICVKTGSTVASTIAFVCNRNAPANCAVAIRDVMSVPQDSPEDQIDKSTIGAVLGVWGEGGGSSSHGRWNRL